MKNNNILQMGIIGTLILVILASGCTTSSTNETKTFSDDDMSFNYPANFYNHTESGNDTDSNSTMQVIGELGCGNLLNMQLLMVGKNRTGTSPTEVRDRGVSKVKNNSKGRVLSITTETNPNGIIVEKSTYTQEDSIFGTLRYNDMFFKINGVVYAISVYGSDSDKQQLNNTANIIFQSIK